MASTNPLLNRDLSKRNGSINFIFHILENRTVPLVLQRTFNPQSFLRHKDSTPFISSTIVNQVFDSSIY